MKHHTALFSRPLTHDLLISLLLLSISACGGWLAYQTTALTDTHSVHARLLFILLVQPFALAAWLFCGLPGIGLALKSLFAAIEQRKALAFVFSAGLMALSLICATFWM